ncbi:MAG: hypothetical protein KC609_00945 [Myxococcales bacterium]|nr:hypothetical protein [Myxococcales bacterium]
MKMRKLTIIGGGSAYAPGLIRALLGAQSRLMLSEVCLHDVDLAHLEIVAALARKMASIAADGFDVSAESRVEEAVRNADVVLNSARPGGFACRRIDETLPLAHEIPGQETVGPGGFFFAMRSVPHALALAALIERYAPQALLLNYTNPTNIVTQAIADFREVRVIGLCDQSDEDIATLALAHGVSPQSITFRCVGLNHATWYSELTVDGRPVVPERTPDLPVASFDDEHALRFDIARDMARQYPGFWPNSYLPYYHAPGEFVALSTRIGPRSDAIVETLDRYYEHFLEESRKDRPELVFYRGGSGFGDLAVRLMTALQSPVPTRLVLNVPNRGACPWLRDDSVIELPVDVDEHGLHRLATPEIPEPEHSLIEQLECYQREAADAVAAGTRRAQIAALSANPLVPSAAAAEALFEAAQSHYGGWWSAHRADGRSSGGAR